LYFRDQKYNDNRLHYVYSIQKCERWLVTQNCSPQGFRMVWGLVLWWFSTGVLGSNLVRPANNFHRIFRCSVYTSPTQSTQWSIGSLWRFCRFDQGIHHRNQLIFYTTILKKHWQRNCLLKSYSTLDQRQIGLQKSSGIFFKRP
jgi:hypothetical protein